MTEALGNIDPLHTEQSEIAAMLAAEQDEARQEAKAAHAIALGTLLALDQIDAPNFRVRDFVSQVSGVEVTTVSTQLFRLRQQGLAELNDFQWRIADPEHEDVRTFAETEPITFGAASISHDALRNLVEAQNSIDKQTAALRGKQQEYARQNNFHQRRGGRR